MKSQTPATKRRVQLDFGPQAMERLERLVEITEASSYAEVIRNAVQLYAGIIDEGGLDARLVVQKQDGTTAIIRVFK